MVPKESDPLVAEWQQDRPGPACSFFPAHFTNSLQPSTSSRPCPGLCHPRVYGRHGRQGKGECPQWAEVQ